MRTHLLLLLILCLSLSSIGQRASIKGSVADTIDRKNLQNTLVTLMRASDSGLVKFTRVDKSGQFSIPDLDSGKYILMITHPYVGDLFDQVSLTPGQTKNMGNISMIPKSKLLAEVIVKSGSPIRIKGDTTIYTADSFKVRPGANVEELLRRLPGISVDKDGKITAMGERVNKVLVEGEEFFGSDPGIVTKNLRADNVKEVQVFDKKSDQAEFTGIDDGVKNKTINLKLKELKGYFGKIELGGGLDQKFNNSAMANAFKAKRKLAAYGIMSNTGQTNLDWQEAQNYGGGMDGMESGVTDDGGVYISINNSGEDNFYGGRNGIPSVSGGHDHLCHCGLRRFVAVRAAVSRAAQHTSNRSSTAGARRSSRSHRDDRRVNGDRGGAHLGSESLHGQAARRANRHSESVGATRAGYYAALAAQNKSSRGFSLKIVRSFTDSFGIRAAS